VQQLEVLHNSFVYFYARLAHSYARLWRLANSGNSSGEAHNVVIFSTGRQMFKGEHKSARGDEARRIAANIAKLPDCWSPAVKREAEEDWGRR
jgi:hypothetical protein